MNPVFIESQEQFDQHYEALVSEDLLAVDTEFFRETTYFPHLGLVQAANSKIVACIDPLAFDARDSIASLLLNTEITKVFHSCSQDLEVLNLYLGALPCPILDTQIAASLIDETEQIGYANLVLSELDVHLDKSQTRTNWLKRPLTSKQLEYAADDVSYLYQLIETVSTKLEKLQRKDWFLEDCISLCTSSQQYEPDITNCGTRVKGTHKLPGLELAIINAIANWREIFAIQIDKNRRRALPDDNIVLIATSKPDSIEKLNQTGQLSRYLSPAELESLFDVIKDSYNIPENEWPVNRRTKLDNEEKKRLEALQQLILKKADELKISSSILCPRKELTQLFNGSRDCRVLKGWRQNMIGNELLSSLAD